MRSEPRVDKFAARRDELGDATLETLAELGYARTSLREIAQKSAFSHGVLHYYFSDKTDLILSSVRRYKARCATRYDDVTASARTFDELKEGFTKLLGETLEEDAVLHRLWYDIRSQAMFEEKFMADAVEIDELLEAMIWRVVSRLSELAGEPPQATSALAYAMFDGLFQRALLRHIAGDRGAVRAMRTGAKQLVEHLFPGVPRTTKRAATKKKKNTRS